MLTFPELIKEIRRSSQLTQKEFAEIVGISTVLLSMVESGSKEVSKSLIVKIAKVLDVHPASITPFLFADKTKSTKTSPVEKSLINLGEKMQIYLIKNRAKKINKNAKSSL